MNKKRNSTKLENSLHTEITPIRNSEVKSKICDKVEMNKQLLKPIKIASTNSNSLSFLTIKNSITRNDNSYSRSFVDSSKNREHIGNYLSNSKY